MPRARVPLQGLLLDADGTLWDTRSAMEAAAGAGVAAAWPDVNREVARRAAVSYRSDPANAFGRFVAGELSFVEMRATRLRSIAEELDLPWDDALVASFQRAYDPAFAEALEAYPDALPLVEWARGAGVPVGILTNSGQDYTLVKIESVGLSGYALPVCSRDCLGVGKPESSVFHHACARLGLDPAHVLYVGDEWVADAQGAADAGLASAWLVRDDGDPAGEVVATVARREAAEARGIPIIGSLAEVPDLLGGCG